MRTANRRKCRKIIGRTDFYIYSTRWSVKKRQFTFRYNTAVCDTVTDGQTDRSDVSVSRSAYIGMLTRDKTDDDEDFDDDDLTLIIAAWVQRIDKH